MKKKLLLLVVSLCMITTIAPMNLLASENSNQDDVVESQPIQELTDLQNTNEETSDLNNVVAEEEELDVNEESTEVEENAGSVLTRNSLLNFASTRNVGGKISAVSPSGDTLRYTILSEDSATNTGTIMVGWPDTVGPGGSTTQGNGTGRVLSNTNLILPETVVSNGFTYTVTKIGNYALSGLDITSIVIPSTVTEFDEYSLNANKIKELNIHEGVTTIGSNALTSGSLEVVRFPSTITHLGRNVLEGNNVLRNVYFPVSNDITVIGSGSNKPFHNFSVDKVVVICKDKEQFKKWNKNGTLFSNISDQTVTYEMVMEFYDRDGKALSFDKPVKKLYGKSISWEQNSEGTWNSRYVSLSDWGTISDLPTLPSEASLGYTANYWGLEAIGLVSVNKDGKIEVSNTKGATTRATNWVLRVFTNKMYAVEEKLEITLNETPEKSYDGVVDLGIRLNRNNEVLSAFFKEETGYWMDLWVFEKGAAQTKYRSYEIMSADPLTKLKNVADNGEYSLAVVLTDSRITNRDYTWSTPFPYYGEASSLVSTIKINPIDIDFNLNLEDIIWNNQTNLPEITLNRKDHGAEGKIVWDANQTPQKGTNSYHYTFVPSDLSAIKATDRDGTVKISNYKTSSKSGSLNITYKEIKKYEVSFVGINGNPIQKQMIEEGKSAVAPTVPNVAGYRFIGWDTPFNNVRSNLTIRAIYEKLPDEKPSGGGTPTQPPVNTSKEEPTTDVKKEELKNDQKNVVENKKEGIKVETSNKNKIFNANAEVVVIDASKQEKKKAEQKLDDIIKVLEVIIKEDGVRVEKTIDSKFKVFLDAKEYKNIENLKVWQKTKEGDYKALSYEIKDGQIVFECDALDTYVLTGKKKKEAIKENDDFPWWIIPLIIAGVGIAFYAYKKSNKESE